MGIHTSFKLSKKDTEIVEREVKRRDIPKWKHSRYMILLLLHKDFRYQEIEYKLDTNSHSISKWKKRYLAEGLEGLKDRPRPGNGNRTSPKLEAKIIALVQKAPPPGKSHWSASEISKQTGVPKRTIADILSRNNLKPHLNRKYMASNDPDFEKKAAEIIGLYLKPPKNAVILCVDEKTQIQALERDQPNLPLKLDKVERSAFKYRRHGISNLYAAFNVKKGAVTGLCSETHNQYNFMSFLNILAKQYKKREVHVILDNASSHKTKNIQEWLRAHPNWKFHYTPTYSSWLNQVETWFSIISRQCIRRASFHSVKSLVKEIKKFIEEYNKDCKPFVWTYNDVARRITV